MRKEKPSSVFWFKEATVTSPGQCRVQGREADDFTTEKREQLGTRPGIQADGAWDDADLRDRAYLEKTGGVAKRG